MKLEEQVCSLELAQKLKELGVKQESHFSWYRGVGNIFILGTNVEVLNNGVQVSRTTAPQFEEYSAFTVAEFGQYFEKLGDNPILEKLPEHLNHSDLWNYFFKADYWAEVLIYLLENKLI